jgi:hypothetical protein
MERSVKCYGVARNSKVLLCNPDGLFDRRVRAVRAVESKRLGREKWWLAEKTREDTAMRASGMHQKRMAEVDGPRLSCRRYLKPCGGFSKAICG